MSKNAHLRVVLSLCGLALTLAACSRTSSESLLKLNSDAIPALVPTPLSDYQFDVHEQTLYVCWIGAVREEAHLFVTSVDLASMRVVEVRDVSQGLGSCVSPDMRVRGNEVELVWLEHPFGKGRQAHYRLHAVALPLERGDAGGHADFEYGSLRYPPKLVSTTRGLFAMGLFSERGKQNRALKLFQKVEGTWQVVSLPDEGASDTDHASLAELTEGLLLIWIREGNLIAANSEDGQAWGPPVTVFSGSADSFCTLSDGSRTLRAVWAEEEFSSSRVWTASYDAASGWGKPVQLGEIPGSSMRYLSAESTDSAPILIYQYLKAGGCWVIESIDLAGSFAPSSVDSSGEMCSGSLTNWSVKDKQYNYVIWWERKKSDAETGLYMNYSSRWENEWDRIPRRILESEKDLVYSSAKLFSGDHSLYLLYFSATRKKGPFPRLSSQGDIMLREVSGVLPWWSRLQSILGLTALPVKRDTVNVWPGRG